MKRLFKLFTVICALFVFVNGASAAVYLKGSDVAQYFPRLVLPLYEKSLYVEIITKDSKTGKNYNKNSAIIALAEGDQCDMALSTWPLFALDNKEVLAALKKAEAKGVRFRQQTFVVDAIVPVVHKSNPVDEITLEELQKIYRGEIKNWNDVAGDKITEKRLFPIELYTTGAFDGKYIIWKSLVLGSARDAGKEGPKDISPVAASDDHKWALGFDSMYYVKSSPQYKKGEIKILKVTNAAGLKAGPAKEFPVSRYLYLITRSDISEQAKDVVRFLRSAEAQKKAFEVYQIPIGK